MISFPNCKINIGLRILEKRADGFHNLESLFYPVNWCDALEIIPANEFSFETSGIKISGSMQDNLCVKAYQLLQAAYNLPPVKVFLLKKIPAGAGLGGGSSDAAFMLKMLNELFNLKISNDQLKQYAAQLGSDCSFFLENKPCFVAGRGDVMKPSAINLSGYHIVVVHPNVFVNTSWAYQELAANRKKTGSLNSFSETKKSDSVNSIGVAVNNPIEKWNQYLKNDFEAVVFHQHPEIESIKDHLYEKGALYASMSGSGSAVYGIFREEIETDFYPEFKIFSGKL